jgi:hypothetical protein
MCSCLKAGIALVGAASLAWSAHAAAPSRALANGFGAMMLITPDAAQFRKAWFGPPPPKLNATTRAYRGKPVHAMIVFSGCRAGPDGNCRVTARFNVTAPNGRPYGKPIPAILWRKAPAPAQKMQLGEGNLAIRIEPGEPLGVYRLGAVVTDEIAGTSLTIEQSVTAFEAP